ncbi:hypothetical protein NDU88_009125 [Pleurodeles waltl]|uniref:Uncharacterized protein n=1 Tax=Pleurodeles waltl TaxID=8319 RepID=A0AAV7RV79_PLEWA|nr:hypothetical protein NDU88_009125 [Pleurodeles waltl]
MAGPASCGAASLLAGLDCRDQVACCPGPRGLGLRGLRTGRVVVILGRDPLRAIGGGRTFCGTGAFSWGTSMLLVVVRWPGPDQAQERLLHWAAKLRIVAENKSHFFSTPEAAWEWFEVTGHTSGGVEGRKVQVPRSKCSRARRAWRRGDAGMRSATHAPDLEQLMQERREAIHSAATISAFPLASDSETEATQ